MTPEGSFECTQKSRVKYNLFFFVMSVCRKATPDMNRDVRGELGATLNHKAGANHS